MNPRLNEMFLKARNDEPFSIIVSWKLQVPPQVWFTLCGLWRSMKERWKLPIYLKNRVLSLSIVWFFANPRTVACQVPLSLGILQARILEWVAMPFPRDLPKPGIEPRSPALQVDSLPNEPPGKPVGKDYVYSKPSWFTEHSYNCFCFGGSIVMTIL